MKNCFVRGYKAAVENESLEVLGFTKLIVDTTGMNENTPVTGYAGVLPVGTYIVGTGTFTNGKKVIDAGDVSQIAPDQVMTLMVPKYKTPVRLADIRVINGKGQFAMDLDGYAWQDRSAVQPSTDYYDVLNLYPTAGGAKMSGSLDNYLWHLSTEVQKTMQFSDVDVSINISESPYLYKFKKLTTLRFQNLAKVTGNAQTLFSMLAQENKAYLKTRTDFMSLLTEGSNNVTFGDVLSHAQNKNILRFYFSGGSTVDVRSTSDGGTTYSTFATYNIDTDIFTLV